MAEYVVEEAITRFFQRWMESRELESRHEEPAEGLRELFQSLEAEYPLEGEAAEGLRIRRSGRPRVGLLWGPRIGSIC